MIAVYASSLRCSTTTPTTRYIRLAVRMSSSITASPLISNRRNAVDILTINRPRALNALNTEVCKLMFANLARWAEDPSISCFILSGEGEKAFCAGYYISNTRKVRFSLQLNPFFMSLIGGDVKTVVQGNDADADLFFKTEYCMNLALSVSPIPQISIW